MGKSAIEEKEEKKTGITSQNVLMAIILICHPLVMLLTRIVAGSQFN